MHAEMLRRKKSRIIQMYFNRNKTGYDSHSVKLLNVIFTNKTTFGYTDSDISKIIEKFWNSLITDLNSAEDPGVFQFFIKFVVSFKSCEELMDMFIGLNLINIAETNVIEKCKTFEKLFRLVFKCEMNKTKGNMFSEFFRQVAFQFIIKIRMFDMQTQHNIRHQLLDCQRLLCTNIKIPISFELIDDIISFMSDTLKYEQINKVSDATILKETHARLSDLCHSLILHRHYFIIDRIPQIVVILKELLQLICWYKCDRGRDKQLDDEEVTILTELSHKLENTTKALVKHTKDVKRVAPYLLLSVMNFMISKENVSTMYSKIKMHFDYICYDLISACDHRVKSFIMRNCNEASKQQYETLMKEYNKYHKFKGKV
ncbi:hypothetical protein Bhyg_02766 [Pseudolycoriella hygida]|uniref:Nucleolar 27S pre-rRNA processing Urb2/Npa2 C-terminal domain-containing protein n=1 Tax=Pseudolycoriella hygida TaxID=35572 RepID=A0A9Q0S832_9DIPT|nr:hypothetical protein Bhyg_02766 [Pseudolycoriella hygida]